jgi:LPXTG-motif cell wall-anchored protein
MIERIRPVWSAATTALALVALTCGTALASVSPSVDYQFSSHPMISGTVVSVNDHQMVVNTDQGEQVALEIDTRTMAPRDFGPGMIMRAEFVALEDCRFYAQRIIAIRGGMSMSRLQAYAKTHDSQAAIANSGPNYGRSYRGHFVSTASSQGRETSQQTMREHSPGVIIKATHTTADYAFSTRALLTGRVITVNDHRLVLDTDQGKRVGMVMDSRTMLPRETAPGADIRTEFSRLDDGRYYVKRISLIGEGVVGREQAYANTRDSEMALADNSSDCVFIDGAGQNTASATLVEPEDERPLTLPQTASQQPLLLLVGLIALGAAGLVKVARRSWLV